MADYYHYLAFSARRERIPLDATSVNDPRLVELLKELDVCTIFCVDSKRDWLTRTMADICADYGVDAFTYISKPMAVLEYGAMQAVISQKEYLVQCFREDSSKIDRLIHTYPQQAGVINALADYAAGTFEYHRDDNFPGMGFEFLLFFIDKQSRLCERAIRDGECAVFVRCSP